MVFLGKPSRACAHCRRRKLRVRPCTPVLVVFQGSLLIKYQCDLRKDACGQCIRAGLNCSGYRDPDQLRIRDETQFTKERLSVDKSSAIVKTVQVSLDEIARVAFFSHYVSGFSRTYDVLERMDNQTPPDKHLAASVDAVSLAFLSFQTHSIQASETARESYSRALPLVKKAVDTPDFLASDSTLLAVLFLDLFEKMMNRDPKSPDSWMGHVRGAMALFKLRDPAQLKTYVGLRLSVRLFTNMLISCVAGNAPVPPALIRLRSDLEPYMGEKDPKWQASGLVVKYANLRGTIQNGLLTTSETIRQAKELDGEFFSLSKRLPPSWMSKRFTLKESSPRVLENYYDVYPDFFKAQTCNLIRIMRILLNNIIRLAYIHSTPGSYDCSYQSLQVHFASQIIDAMAKEICATGPQFTGVDQRGRTEDFSPLRNLHSYTLLYPFYVAGMHASSESGVREWAVEQLRFLSNTSGIRNAAIVADMLEKKDGTSPWAVYAILGSYAFAA